MNNAPPPTKAARRRGVRCFLLGQYCAFDLVFASQENGSVAYEKKLVGGGAIVAGLCDDAPADRWCPKAKPSNGRA